MTPATGGLYDCSTEHQTCRIPLSTLRAVDLHDISETSTVCDDAAVDTSPSSKDEKDVGDVSTAPHSKQDDCPLPNVAPHFTRRRQATVASGYSEVGSPIVPSYATESGPGDKVREISIGCFVV